ncbi:unnamed protein product [Brassica rapa]|uniref:Uncharacterized protein n=1 Tax=Brassica campestris TaxID=3711 RepID=A0A8D9HWD4_BRACM|nr:unnamed protein product [Brassica rapa]
MQSHCIQACYLGMRIGLVYVVCHWYCCTEERLHIETRTKKKKNRRAPSFVVTSV